MTDLNEHRHRCVLQYICILTCLWSSVNRVNKLLISQHWSHAIRDRSPGGWFFFFQFFIYSIKLQNVGRFVLLIFVRLVISLLICSFMFKFIWSSQHILRSKSWCLNSEGISSLLTHSSTFLLNPPMLTFSEFLNSAGGYFLKCKWPGVFSWLVLEASVTKRRGIGPIRTEISPYKIRKKLFIF